MRVHRNRDLFVRAQQNAQRRKLDGLLMRCPKHIGERLAAAQRVCFPVTSEFLKRHLPISNDGCGRAKVRPATYHFLVVEDPIKAFDQIDDAVTEFPDLEMLMSLGEPGGVSFGEEHFVDLTLPMFAARPSHWSGVWAELFGLGSHGMSAVFEDGSFGVIVESNCGGDLCDNVFEIGRWNDARAVKKHMESIG